MAIKYACVCFVQEKNIRYVVLVKDIKDFKPRGIDDFVPEKLYDVVWPVLRRQDSDTTEDYFRAKILLLSATTASMVVRAKAAKVVLPPSFIQLVKDKERDDTQAQSKEDAAMVAKRASSRTKKQVRAAMQLNCEQRMRETAKAYDDNAQSSSQGGHEKRDPNSQRGKSDSVVMEEKDKTTNKQSDSIFVEMENATVSKPSDSVMLEEEDGTRNMVSDSVVEGEGNRNSRSDLVVEHEESGTRRESMGTVVSSLTKKGVRKCRIKRKKEDDDSDSNSDSSGGYVSSSTEVKRLQAQVMDLQAKLTSERKKRRIAEAEVDTLKSAVESWTSDFSQFSKLKPSGGSPQQSSEKQPPKESPAKESPLKLEPTTPSVKCSPRISKWVDTTLQYSGGVKGCPSTKSSPPPKNNIRRTLTFSSDSKSYGDVIEIKSAPSLITTSPAGSPKHTFQCSLSGSAVEKHRSPKKSPKKKEKKKTPVAKVKSELGPDELSNKDLCPMILGALSGETKLQADGKGSAVHLGNGVWIKQSVWDDKISQQSMKLSLVVRDLAEEIWGYKKCAQFSVTGGKSPKTPGAEPKLPPPAGAQQVIYAVVRAKKRMQGMNVDSHLDEFISTTAVLALRNKFKDSADKVRTENARALAEDKD